MLGASIVALDVEPMVAKRKYQCGPANLRPLPGQSEAYRKKEESRP